MNDNFDQSRSEIQAEYMSHCFFLEFPSVLCVHPDGQRVQGKMTKGKEGLVSDQPNTHRRTQVVPTASFLWDLTPSPSCFAKEWK